jgi:hypothetical protein
LNRAESAELAMELLGEVVADGAADQRILDALFDRSGGNPLFLQELAVLVAREGPTSELPESLRALIAARLDQLSPAERQVLDNAAVLGMSGVVGSLERFAEKMQQEFDPAIVTRLDSKGFLTVDGRHWEFRSESVREARTRCSRRRRGHSVTRAWRRRWRSTRRRCSTTSRTTRPRRRDRRGARHRPARRAHDPH